jgi:fructosamine-3-kinase
VTSDVRDALATLSDDYEIRRQLHAVPPHAVYEVTVSGTRAVCKVAREPQADPATEARVMEYVGREVAVPVPRILAVDRDWFVAEWRDSLPGDDPALDPERARVMGAGLATLHDETAGAFEKTGFPRAENGGLEVETHESWAETVRARLADLRDYLADFGCGDVATAARSFVREHPNLLTDAGEQADARAHDPVLAHGNYLPDHVAVADDEETCVIDWEHALVASAEYDYWRTAMPLFRSPGDTEAEEAAFHEGYESVRPLPAEFDDRSLAHRMVIIVSHLQSLHLQRQHDDHGTARFERFAREYVFDAIEELGGEVER